MKYHLLGISICTALCIGLGGITPLHAQEQTSDLVLHFLTGFDTPKFAQIRQNPKCCLYYFNPQTRHAVRLFGEIKAVADTDARKKYWRDDYKQLGYTGADDPEYILLEFTPRMYKFYDTTGMKTGLI